MNSPDIFLDRIEFRGIIVGTNNADEVPVGTLFTQLVKNRYDGAAGLGQLVELWSAPISLRLVDAVVFRKSVPTIPRGWSAGLVLEGTGRYLIEQAIREKQEGEFVHLRVADTAGMMGADASV